MNQGSFLLLSLPAQPLQISVLVLMCHINNTTCRTQKVPENRGFLDPSVVFSLKTHQHTDGLH